jgi:hypothetical protein
MITTANQPLAIASKVLQASTIKAIRQSSSFNLHGWKILDRWALNSPERLRDLEQESEMLLLGRVLQQQRIELEAITSLPADAKVGLTESEILQLQEIAQDL